MKYGKPFNRSRSGTNASHERTHDISLAQIREAEVRSPRTEVADPEGRN